MAISVDSTPDEIQNLLPPLLVELGSPPWAARSSGVAEDSATQSFAGQYETLLGLTTPEAVIDAVVRVRASGSAPHVAQYAGSEQLSEIGVLIQRMITAERAGVCFTHDPVTAEPIAIIESAWGLGISVVEGRVIPDSFTVRRNDEVVHTPSRQRQWYRFDPIKRRVGEQPLSADQLGRPSLSLAEARQVARLAVGVMSTFGFPLDIEWCFDSSDHLWLLQARPITSPYLSPRITIDPGRSRS